MSRTIERGCSPGLDPAAASKVHGGARRPALGREGRAWVLALVLLPLLAFALPALVGHPVLLGDDLTQNEPLRALVGADLRHGRLPLFDPYLWSGSPLLGGWNAGAAYPLTWLFAVLPGAAAWTAGLVATWWVAGVSFFALARRLGLGATASGVAALSFVFGGAFVAQVVHFGLVAGLSWVPLQLLAVTVITGARDTAAAARGTALLGGSLGLTVLAGDPRAFDDALVLVACFAAWRLLRLGRRRLASLAALVAGVGLGVGLGALQLLPGLDVVAGSQRAGALSTSFFASGSLRDRWLPLLLVPDLLGGSGSLRQPAFLASYSLTEVSGYLGALPVVGALALLGRLRRGRPPEWLVWHLVVVVGILLALGVNTPLGGLLAHVPFYGAQRLQSRNIAVADVGLALLLGYFVDGVVEGPSAGGARGPALGERALGLAGAALLAAPVLAVAVGGDGFLTALGAHVASPSTASALLPELVPFLVLGVLAGAVVVGARRVPRRARRRLVVGLVVANLAVFATFVVLALPPTSSGRGSPAVASGATGAGGATGRPGGRRTPGGEVTGDVRPIAALGLGGRFAVYDPDLYDGAALVALGTPDANAPARTPSVLGYGSIVWGRYATATGAHGLTGRSQDVFAPRAAADGVFDELDTTTLATVPSYLVTASGGGGPAPGAGTGSRRLPSGGVATWYLGTPTAVRSVAVGVRSASAGARARLGLLLASGATRWLAPAARVATRATLEGAPAAPLVAVGLRVAARGGLSLAPPRIVTGDGRRLVADGQLAGAVVPPRWRYAGRDGPFAVFRDVRARPMLRLLALPGRSLGAASLGAASGPAAAPGSVEVASRGGAVVVRAVSDLPGWRATWQPAGGRPRALALRRDGLVQAVAVPPGRGRLSWRYDPPGLAAGAAASLGSLVVLALLGALGLLERRPRPSAHRVRRLAKVASWPTRRPSSRTRWASCPRSTAPRSG